MPKLLTETETFDAQIIVPLNGEDGIARMRSVMAIATRTNPGPPQRAADAKPNI